MSPNHSVSSSSYSSSSSYAAAVVVTRGAAASYQTRLSGVTQLHGGSLHDSIESLVDSGKLKAHKDLFNQVAGRTEARRVSPGEHEAIKRCDAYCEEHRAELRGRIEVFARRLDELHREGFQDSDEH